MSMPSLEVSVDNPVSKQDVLTALKSINSELTMSSEELESYHKTVAAAHDSCELIRKLPDYIPLVDLDRFSRTEVYRPNTEQNPTNAWAWRCHVKDNRDNKGLLAGKSLCLKDNISLAAVPSEYGTEVFTDWTPKMDATAAKRALEQGVTITGKAVCENLSIFANSASAASGPMHNPHAKGYSAGGSSSGCAVLVASGLVDMALAGDQGGSIRLPASHVGIVGLKPTYGLIPYTGIGSVDSTIDHTGPMAKNVLDAALLLEAVAGADGIDDRQLAGCPLQSPKYSQLCQQPIKGMRIGIIAESLDFTVSDQRISTMVVEAAKSLEQVGAIVEQVSIPSHKLGSDVWSVVARWSGAQTLLNKGVARRQHFQNDLTEKLESIKSREGWSKVFPATKNLILCGAYMHDKFDAQLIGKAMNLNRMVKDHYDAALDKYDVLITPTLPFCVRKLADTSKSPLDILSTVAGAVLNSAGFNLTGHPALSIPIGKISPLDDPSVSLPVGMQVIGEWWKDEDVLKVGYAYEQLCL